MASALWTVACQSVQNGGFPAGLYGESRRGEYSQGMDRGRMENRQIAVLYDDTCAFCRRWLRLAQRLDWRTVLDPCPMSSQRASELIRRWAIVEPQHAIHCITPVGEVHQGARCLRHLALRLPLAVPIGLLLWLPGVIRIAEAGYDWVSQRRHQAVTRRQESACSADCGLEDHQAGSIDKPSTQKRNMFSHVVIFWTDPDNPGAADELIAGANQYLKPIPGIQHFHVGRMVSSHRPVVDQTYQVALNVTFPDKRTQDDYQVHPLHLEFVEKVFKRVCRKVAVYDFE